MSHARTHITAQQRALLSGGAAPTDDEDKEPLGPKTREEIEQEKDQDQGAPEPEDEQDPGAKTAKPRHAPTERVLDPRREPHQPKKTGTTDAGPGKEDRQDDPDGPAAQRDRQESVAPSTSIQAAGTDQARARRRFRQKDPGQDEDPGKKTGQRDLAQQEADRSALERAGTALRAFDPITEGGEQARKRVRAVADEAEGAAGTALDWLGPPQTQAGAAIEAGLALAPIAAPAGAGRAAGKGLSRIGRGPLGEGAEQATRRTAREVAETTAPQAGRRATREATEEAVETTAQRTARRTAGKEASEEVAEEGLTGALRKGARVARRNPGKTALAGGTLLGGALLADDALDPMGPTRVPQGGDDPAAPAGGDGTGTGGAGGGGGGDLPPHVQGPGAAGSGPFGPTGIPGVLEIGALDRVAGGLGAAFDRVGQGIADTMRGLGIPIGEGAGKAIAVGGTLLATAYGVSLVIESAGVAGAASAAGAAGGAGASTGATASAGLPEGVTRGPSGQFVSA